MYTQHSNNLIISADDFGVSETANHNILALARAGKIDRAGVMMGGQISPEEARGLLESGIKLDIHLHLLEADYFAKRNGESERNVFGRMFIFAVDVLSGRYSSGKVKLIWKKQIEDFHVLFGKYPDGLNSHEHMHFFPPFFRVALALKEKFGISFMRLGKWEHKTGLNFTLVAFILNTLRRINARLNQIFVTPPHIAKDVPFVLNTSDFLVSFDWIKDYDKFFDQLPSPGQTELVFHPERPDEFEFLKENF
ncbi:MAG: ChbG/HpnK family deacetylase [Parcubacteria group bacterium]